MPYDMALLSITLSVATLMATILGLITAILSSMDGAPLPRAIIRAGVAFGGTLTLAVLVLTLIAQVVHH